MHPRGDRAQQLEGLRQSLVGRRRLDPGQPLEVHDVARVGCTCLVQREQPPTVVRGQHVRRTDARLLTQGRQPDQLGLDLGGVVVAVPVDSQHGPLA